MVNLEAREIQSEASPAPSPRFADWLERNPLPIALAIQAILLSYRLDLLEPWGDEWFSLKTAPIPLNQMGPVVEAAAYPPLYYFLLHFWIHIPWPATPLVKMRAMSVLWTLLATIIFDRLWLAELEPRARRMVLALWVLSPCLLLYSRMARYYSMVLVLALVAFYTASKWLEHPDSPRWMLAYCCSTAALLYTHYMPGLAIIGAVGLMLLTKPAMFSTKRVMLLTAPVLIIALLYLPWLTALFGALGEWRAGGAYRVGNLFFDQLVRIAYWFVSFTFGETLSAFGIVLGIALMPAILFAINRGIRARPRWIYLVGAASLIGYAGVSRWTGFPFTPARVLFALPFFLILVVKGIDASRRGSIVFAGLLLIYVSGDYNYFARVGYLNKGYCAPYREMADVIVRDSAASGGVLFVDGYNSVPEPLLNRLGKEIRVISVDDPQSVESEVGAVRHEPLVWFWRHTHDTSPGGFVSKLEVELARGRTVQEYDFLPYSMPERWILQMLRGPGQPDYFYSLSEMRLRHSPVFVSQHPAIAYSKDVSFVGMVESETKLREVQRQ